MSYSKHLVAFIDLLGFSEAMRDRERSDSILALLTKLAAFRGDFYAESREIENGRQSLIRPAISAFSDNIVLSYPIDSLVEHGVPLDAVVIFLQKLVAYIAWNAFQCRLLIRGGLAIGDAYHSGGVVFGPALIEAHEIERKLAIYPRVAIGPSISRSEALEKLKNHIWTHDDGVTALGYMLGFVLRTEAAGGRSNLMVKSWIADVRAAIQAELRALNTTQNVRAASKWAWFDNNFERNLERIPPDILELNTPAEP